jgi:alkylhydroperoxidase family enzyme
MNAAMRAEMERCAREGTPRPESSAVRAHVPGAFWSFANSWRDIFHTGVCDHAIKELCRLYVSRSVKCEFCGNQRSIKAFSQNLDEAQTDDLMNFEKSTHYSDKQKAALAYAEAITWRAHDGTAKLAAAAQYRAPPGDDGNGCFDGAGIGKPRSARQS